MKQISAALVMLALFVQPAVSAQPQAGPEISLHCTGETWVPIGNQEKTETEAFVRITNKETFIEINAVGYGTFAGRPKPITNMQAHGIFLLRSVSSGRDPVEVQFNINRFTGHLSIFQVNAKVHFIGKCKQASPLF